MPTGCKARLRLLETTDLHMQLTGYDYLLGNHDESKGLANLSGLITSLRNDGIETILCDNGDFIEGSPLADQAIDLDDMTDHPLVRAMNHLSYDAISLGNHEFDYGTDKLRQVISALDAPVVCSNVRVSQHEHFTMPWTIASRQLKCSDGKNREIKIGLIGFVTPIKSHWGDRQKDIPLITDDIIAAAMTHIPALRRAGADLVVAIAHTGIGEQEHSYMMENAARPLAALRGIDVALLGHTHDRFPSCKFNTMPDVNVAAGTISGTPAVKAGHRAEMLGQIDLTLDWNDGDWSISGQKVTLHGSSEVIRQPLQDFSNVIAPILAPLHDKTLGQLSHPLADCPEPIDTFFANVGYDPMRDLVARSSMAGVQPGLKGTQFEGLPLIGAASSFVSGGLQGPRNYLSIKKGEFRSKHLFATCPFDNTICAVLRRGWQIREWLERGSEIFNTVSPEIKDQQLMNPDFPTYHFDALVGLDYTFNLAIDPMPMAPQGRVSKLEFEGKEVLDDDLFVVATSLYRALGGGMMGHVPQGDIIYQTPSGIRGIIKSVLADGFQWSKAPQWQFDPISGATALFPSGKTAGKHIPNSSIEEVGNTTDGFTEFRLTL